MRKSLTKNDRLKSSADLRKVFASPNRVNCGGAKLFFKKNPEEKRRFAVSLIRKFGHSVCRNRAKRQFREIYRLNQSQVQEGWDLIFVLYPGNYEYKDREKQFFSLIQRANIQR